MLDDHAHRIHLAISYIHAHFDQDINLADLAQAVHFSPYHFHRVFTAIQHETPNDYLRRIRIERAANLLLIHPPFPMQQIALDCGFKSQALFSRAFRSHFGISASQWRKDPNWYHDGQFWKCRKNTDQESKNCKVSLPPIDIKSNTDLQRSQSLLAARRGERPAQIIDISTKILPAFRWAYFWQNGASVEAMLALWQKAVLWAAQRDLLNENAIGVSRMFDSPSMTDTYRCRYEVGLIVAADFKAERHVLLTDIPAGQYLVVDYLGTVGDEALATEYFYNYWLPRSKWTLDDRPSYIRASMNNALKPLHPDTVFSYQWCIPVRASKPGPKYNYQVSDFSN